MSKDLEVHQTVNAVVEIVKENYLASTVKSDDILWSIIFLFLLIVFPLIAGSVNS
jgi:hypothetical protein